MTTLLDISNITCRYDAKQIFANLSFSVDQGSIACLLGPSGCGKTTALRAIAGFEPVYAGTITLDGRTLSAPGMALPPEQRQVGMVFQDYALFPHLSVADNIGFGLQHQSRAVRQHTTGELLELIRLQDYAKVYPHQLSGGQQQRVALARALAPRPKLLLLDEPFSNLDTELRRSLSLEVRNILRLHGTTAILVTHDQTEAFNVADIIGVMAEGKLLQWGSARELYHTPASPFVAAFVSNGQLIPAQVLAPGRLATIFGEITLPAESPQPMLADPLADAPLTRASAGAAAAALANPDSSAGGPPVGAMVDLLLRPWNIVLNEHGSATARIVSQQFNGAVTLSMLELTDGSAITSLDERLALLPLGSTVRLSLSPSHLCIFAR